MKTLNLWKVTYSWVFNSSSGMSSYKVEHKLDNGYFATTASSIEGLRHFIDCSLGEQSDVQSINHAEFLGHVWLEDL